MRHIFQIFSRAFTVPEIRTKLLFTLFLIVVFRVLAFIPLPGIEPGALANFFSQNEFLALLDVFSGGTLANFSIIALGLNPYINASIIIQLLTVIFPSLEKLQKEEGEQGREKINNYTRLLTIPLCIVQSFGMYALLRSQGLVTVLAPFDLITMVLTLSAGTMFLVWLGELITQHGLGNGVSILIFAGIVGRMPVVLSRGIFGTVNFDPIVFVGYALLAIFVIAAIVYISEGVRKIPVQYARRVRGSMVISSEGSHLPLRVNQAGVIPLIFGISLVLLPSILMQYLVRVPNDAVVQVGQWLAANFTPQSALYNLVYFALVFFFTYFYTAIAFNTKTIAEQLRKHGGFVVGIRPGKPTEDYLNTILGRVTFFGGLFLGAIAVLPSVIGSLTGTTSLILGGTGILIVVSVIIETSKQIESLFVMHNYDAFLREVTMTIALVGLPGSGKSTQSKKLAEYFNLHRVETGELFRKIAQQDTPLGKRIAETLAKGDLVEEADMNLALSDLFHEMTTPEPVIVDGFPRDLYQAKMYRKNLDKCYFLDVEDSVAMERLLLRKRADDTPHVVQLRIKHFRERTQPMIDWLAEEGILERIDASETPETVFEKLICSIGPLVERK